MSLKDPMYADRFRREAAMEIMAALVSTVNTPHMATALMNASKDRNVDEGQMQALTAVSLADALIDELIKRESRPGPE